MPRPRDVLFLSLAVGLCAARPARATTWSVEATVSDERETTVTEGAGGSETTETFEQSYSVTYETEINPALLLSIDFTLDVTDEINEGPDPDSDFDTREISPAVDVELQAVWWDFAGSWEQTENTTDDPLQEKTVDTTWDLEFTSTPESEAAPETKIKYQRDASEEGGTTQQVDETLEANLDYTFWDLLDLTFDVSKDTTDDRITLDQDTEDRSYQVELSFDREFGDSFKLEAEWSNERQQSVTLAESDDVLERDDTLDNNFRVQGTYIVLEDLELLLDREIDWAKDLEADTLEVTDTWTWEANYGASLTETIDTDLSYSDERTDTRGGTSNSYAITRDYAVAFDFSPFENLTLSPSWDRSDSVEWFDDPEQATDDTVDDTWEIQLDASAWDDQVELSLTRTWSITEERGARTTDERNWDVDLTLTLENVPNFEISPQYTYTEDVDRLNDTTDLEREVEVNLVYEISLDDVLVLTLDHTYTRTSVDPAEGASNIERNDDTDITLSWAEFFEGMTLELNMNRQASDTSEDDEEAIFDYTYSATYDWTFLENYAFSFEYEQDNPDDGEDSRNYLTTFSLDFLDGLLTVDLEYEFDQQLGETEEDTYRYLIEVQGTF